jgi:pyruvate dehydrogenase E2 component (dihydrolipoamide acetyltransferase)
LRNKRGAEVRYIFKFPDIGEGIHEGTILEWYIDKGQPIKMGDPVVKMETDKVVADIPSPRDGQIAARYGKIGDVIQVGEPLVEIEIEGVSGEAAQEIAVKQPKHDTKEPLEEKGFGVVGTLEVAGNASYLPAGNDGVSAAGVDAPGDKPQQIRKALATPVARAMAKDLGVDINNVRGTGPGGRVMKEDIKKYYDGTREGRLQPRETVPAAQEEGRVEIQPLSQIRKTIAKNMMRSKQNAAHMTLFEDVEVTELIRIRDKFKDKFKERGTKLTYLPFILKALVASLKRHRTLNSELDLEGGRMILKNYYNIGIAVDAPDGLVVPIVKDADKLSIFDIAGRIQDISVKAKDRKLTLDDMKDGTFSVTNYGALGGSFGTPVINYPQAAILGVGKIAQKPVVKDGTLAIGNVLPLSLSADHRIVDGGEATRFMLDLMAFLRDPVSLLLE